LADLDITQLIVFDAIYRNVSVTKAARALDLPQATLSRGLAKLRSHFNDALFVRTKQGMQPTPIAENLVAPIAEMLKIYQTRLRNAGGFDPATTLREFNIAISDIDSVLVLPALHRVSEAAAPFVKFSATPLGRQELITGLESGEVDLAIGNFKELYGCVRSQTLAADKYVCLTRRNVRNSTKPPSLQVFRTAKHVLVDARATGGVHQQVERRLLEICPPQNIRLISESFLVAGLLIDQGDFILTVPSRAASLLCEKSNLVAFKPPVDFPEFKVTQYWHERYHNEPGNQWLRRTIRQIFVMPRPTTTAGSRYPSASM
jgi:DNA-binding transcriptional LysR family regulator